MTFGLDALGLEIKRASDIKTELEASFRATFGQAINLDARSILGQIIGIVSEREALVWELIEEVYLSEYPDTSEGVSLDNVAAITGTVRKSATKSTGTATLIGVAGTVIPLGSVVSVLGDSTARFVTNAAATILAGVNEVQTISFSVLPTNGTFALSFGGQVTADLDETTSAEDLELALEALSTIDQVSVTGNFTSGFVVTFQGSNGLSPQAMLVVDDNSLTPATVISVVETTPGAFPQVNVGVTAEETGEVQALAGTLTVIETPVSGWTSVTNALDADIGSAVETDQELKLRRLQEIAIAGKATIEAIRSALLAITDVTVVVVFENNSALEDSEGRPPHSVDIVVENGDDTEIGEKIFDVVAAGIETIGSITEVITDSQGFAHNIRFSRPDNINIWVEIDLTVDSDIFPVDGDEQVRDLIVAFGDSIGIGNDVIVFIQLICSFGTVPGILDVVVRIEAAPIVADGTSVVTAADNAGELEFTDTAHGLVENNRVTFTNSGGALPTGIDPGVIYHVVNPTLNTFFVSTTRGGDPIVFANAGTGTHSVVFGGRDDNIVIGPREVAKFDTSRTTVTVL